MTTKRHFFFAALSLIAGLESGFIVAPVQAVSFTVTIDTTNLATQPTPPAPFSLEFQFNDGGGTVTNTVTLSNFNFGTGGGAAGTPTYNCTSGAACSGISGNLSGTVTLGDSSDFFNEFIQPFTPSAADPLSFLLDLTTNVEPVTPDAFSLAILDWQGVGIPTAFFDVFVQIDLTSPLTIATYGSDISHPLGIDLPAPTVRTVQVPEPAISLLLAVGLAAVALQQLLRSSRRFKRRSWLEAS